MISVLSKYPVRYRYVIQTESAKNKFIENGGYNRLWCKLFDDSIISCLQDYVPAGCDNSLVEFSKFQDIIKHVKLTPDQYTLMCSDLEAAKEFAKMNRLWYLVITSSQTSRNRHLYCQNFSSIINQLLPGFLQTTMRINNQCDMLIL